MGYYTTHELEIKYATEEQLVEIFEYLHENEDIYYGLNITKPSDYYEYSDSVKWYDHNEDMRVLANKFPDATFILHGEGEEQGDVWETMYHGNCEKTRTIESTWSDWR